MVFRREPALWSGLAAAVIQLVSAFVLPLSPDQQGVLNAAVVAVLGLVTAVVLRSDGVSAAVLGLIKASIALGLAFGLSLTTTQQAVLMSVATAVTAMFVRTQETAPAEPTLRPART